MRSNDGQVNLFAILSWLKISMIILYIFIPEGVFVLGYLWKNIFSPSCLNLQKKTNGGNGNITKIVILGK